MNADRAENSCSDECSHSITSTTSSSSSSSCGEDLAWDNYSPPLRTCTDECSCSPSASQCTSCGRLTSCHSFAGGPCSSLKSWPESTKVPISRDRSPLPPPAWPCSRGGSVRRYETDSQSTVDDLKSIDSPSCSKASRLVSASQDGVFESSVVLSGKPSSASIDFRRKCTAYWDGVRSLHSLASSTGCPTEATTPAEDTCTSAYSLLSLPNSESSHQSDLRIFQSFRASDGTVQVDRISLARTCRPHSADDISRLRIDSDQEKRSDDDDDDPTTSGHGTKRISSAVQFSQVVTTHCYDNEFSYCTALPVRDCDAICQSDCEVHEEHKDRRDKLNTEDDACNHRPCKDLAVAGDNAESEHTGDKDCCSSTGHRHRHHGKHGHRSKQHRDHNQNKLNKQQQRDRDQQYEEPVDHSREQCNRGLLFTDHNEDSLPCRDEIDCWQSCRDNDDHSLHSRPHNDTCPNTSTVDHHYPDSKLTDHCHDLKDQHRHVHHVRQHDEHCHGPRDHDEHGNRKRDHSEDHYDQRHHNREHVDSNKYCDKNHQCRTDIDSSHHGLTDPCDHVRHVKDNSDRCDDSKEHIDHGHRSRERYDRFRESRGQSDRRDVFHRRDICSEPKDNTDHEHHKRDLENSGHDSKDHNVHAHGIRDIGDSYVSRDKIEHNIESEGRDDSRPCFVKNLDYDCAHNRDSALRSSEHQSFDSYCKDQSFFKDCTRKKNHNERPGYKHHYKQLRESEDISSRRTDRDQCKDHKRQKDNECGFFQSLQNDSECHFQDQQDQKHPDCVKRKRKRSIGKIHKDPSSKTCKDLESYGKGFNSGTGFDIDDCVKDLKRRRSRFPDFRNFEEERESERVKKQNKKKNENVESEVWMEKIEAKHEGEKECNSGDITDSLILRSIKACTDTQPEYQVEETPIDVDFKFCEYPEAIPPLEYFMGRATVSIEGDLDELPRNTSPFLYKPQPPLRYPTPEPAKQLLAIEPVLEVKSKQSYEQQLELPPHSLRTPSRIAAQVAPVIFTAQAALCMPGKMPGTPVVARQSTVECDKTPTSIRGKAENMPIVCRYTPMQMGDTIGLIEPVSKKQSRGLKPELVRNELAKIASITKSSFVEHERRMPSKIVGWVEQAAPIPSIAPGGTAASSIVDESKLDSTAAYTSHDRHSVIDPRSLTAQGMNYSSAENRGSPQTPGSKISSVPAKSTLRSILVGNRVPEETRRPSMPGGSIAYSTPDGGRVSGGSRESSSMPGGSRMSSVLRGSRVSSTPGGSKVSSTPEGGRLSSFAYAGRLTSYDESSSYAYPEVSDTSVGPEDARYSIIPDFDNTRHSFGYSHRRTTVHLDRQTNFNPNGLIISHFDPKPQVLVAPPKVAEEDFFYIDPSTTGVEIIPAIHDITVQIPSLTKPPQLKIPAKPDDSELTCLKELLAVPLSGQNNSDSEISADSNGQLCKASSRSSDPGADTSTGAVPFSQPQSSSKRPLLNLYPSENCLCTSVTQVVSRSTKHGTCGEKEARTAAAAARDNKRNSSYRSKWYRSLSSKTIHDIPSEGSIPDRNSGTSETRSEACHSSRTSTWVDCYTLPGSEMRRSPEACTHHHLDANEYGEEMREASSCTDSVTTIYTRIPTSSARRTSLNCCNLPTEPCDENCFTSSTRFCEEFEPSSVSRNRRQSSPVLPEKVSCDHCCPPAGDRIISSTVVASRRNHRCKTVDWNDVGRSREQTFERKYKALKQFCIETLGCVPPPATPHCFE